MPELATLTVLMEAMFVPAIGIVVLMLAKLTEGHQARKSERTFYVSLVIMTVITARTVALQDPCWLIHTGTLGMMVVGALTIPPQPNSEDNVGTVPSDRFD